MKYRFYKNDSGWFIDLKWFPFKKAWLAMVAGADDLLEILAAGEKEVTLEVSTTGPIPFYSGRLHKKVSTGILDGAFYDNRKPGQKRGAGVLSISTIWLCAATLWVFWRYPKTIWYKKVND